MVDLGLFSDPVAQIEYCKRMLGQNNLMQPRMIEIYIEITGTFASAGQNEAPKFLGACKTQTTKLSILFSLVRFQHSPANIWGLNP